MSLTSRSTLQTVEGGATRRVISSPGGGGAVSELAAYEYDTNKINLGSNLSATERSRNSDTLQELVDRASGGRKILQLPSGVIEHDQPLRFYSTSSNSFDSGGGLRIEGVQKRLKEYQAFGTRLKYTGDPSLIPYQFSKPGDAHRRLEAHNLNFEASTNRGVPVVRVHSVFQGSDFINLYIRQGDIGDGMIVRDSWSGGNCENITIERNDSRPYRNGVGFQFHNDNFGAGNQKVTRINASGFRYPIVIGGLELQEGALQNTTRTSHLNGFDGHVGIVHGTSAFSGFGENSYSESFSKAGLWVINRAGRTVNQFAVVDTERSWNAAVQVGMNPNSPQTPPSPITGTVDTTNGATLRDTSTDFGDRSLGVSVGDFVYNTSGTRPHPRTVIEDLKTEKTRGNSASGEVNEIDLADDIFSGGDSYALSTDLDDRIATTGQRETVDTATVSGSHSTDTVGIDVSTGGDEIDLLAGHEVVFDGHDQRYTVRSDTTIASNSSGTLPIQEPGLQQSVADGEGLTTLGQFDGVSSPSGAQAATGGIDLTLASALFVKSAVIRYFAAQDTTRSVLRNIGGQVAARGTTSGVQSNKLIDSGASFDTNDRFRIGDTVYNEDTGAETTVTDIDSATQLSLADDIFPSSGQTYAITGVVLVYNYDIPRGLELEEINRGRFVSDAAVQLPDFVASSTGKETGEKDRYLTPQSVEGALFERQETLTGSQSIPSNLADTRETRPVYTVFPDGSDATVSLPDPSNSDVRNRVVKINHGDASSSNDVIVEATNADVRGPNASGGSVTLGPLEGIILQAQVGPTSGDWGWNVISPATNQIPADFDNDGTIDIDPIQKISTTGDTQNVFSAGGDPGELLVDLDPLAERAEDETITGIWDHDEKLVISSADNPRQYDNANALTSLEIDESPATAIQVNGGIAPFRMNVEDGSGPFHLRWNVYFDGSSEKYDVGSEPATQLNFGRSFLLERAPGGVVDNDISWNQAIYANDQGNVAFGSFQANHQVDITGVGRSDTRLRAPEFESDQTDYAGGWAGSGYQLAEVGYNSKPDFAEFSHLSVRGTLRVRELEVRQITFSKGPFGVSPGAGKLGSVASSSHTPISNTFSSATLQEWSFENSGDAEERHGMASGDRILAQRFDPSSQTVVAQVRAVVDNVPDQYTIEVSVDDTYTVPATGEDEEGYEFVVVASTNSARDNFIFLDPYGPSNTAYDGLSDFNDWDNRSDFVRHRSGNLNSYYDYTSDAYGMAAGDHQGNYITADATNGVRIVDNNSGTNIVRALFSGDVIRMGDPSDHHVRISDTQIRMFDDNGRRMVRISGGNNSSITLGDEVNNNDHVKVTENGFIISDGTTWRASLFGTTFTLGDTAGEHIIIDPNQSGVQMINANGTEVGRFDGSLLRLGSNGQIVFDPSQSPEATIAGTLQMGDGSGNGKIVNANTNYRVDESGVALDVPFDRVESSSITFFENLGGTEDDVGSLHAESGDQEVVIDTFDLHTDYNIRFSANDYVDVEGVQFLNGALYFINPKPSDIEPGDIPAGTAVLYAREYTDGNINLKWAENPDGQAGSKDEIF